MILKSLKYYFLSGKYDRNNAVVTLHPGAGWNLSRRIGQKCYIVCIPVLPIAMSYHIKELDYLEGEEAGIKSLLLLVSGENMHMVI